MANQNDPFAGVNMDIVNNALPPDVKANLQQVQANVDKAVNDVVTSFGQNLQSKLAEMTANNAAQLQQSLTEIFNQNINPIADQVSQIQQTVAAMKAASPDNQALQQALDTMNQHATALNTTLNDAKAKVANLGSTIGAGANQIIKKVIPIPL